METKLTYDEVLSKCNELFNKEYAKLFVELNANVFPSVIREKQYVECPVIKLGPGGGTQMLSKVDATSVALNPPAKVSTEITLTHSVTAIYRIAFEYLELEIAANNPAYFKTMMDQVLPKAIANYELTWGSRNITRYGSKFIEVAGGGFRSIDPNDLIIELRFTGRWSTGEEVVSEQGN
jgi:hypothetical protein